MHNNETFRQAKRKAGRSAAIEKIRCGLWLHFAKDSGQQVGVQDYLQCTGFRLCIRFKVYDVDWS